MVWQHCLRTTNSWATSGQLLGSELMERLVGCISTSNPPKHHHAKHSTGEVCYSKRLWRCSMVQAPLIEELMAGHTDGRFASISLIFHSNPSINGALRSSESEGENLDENTLGGERIWDADKKHLLNLKGKQKRTKRRWISVSRQFGESILEDSIKGEPSREERSKIQRNGR